MSIIKSLLGSYRNKQSTKLHSEALSLTKYGITTGLLITFTAITTSYNYAYLGDSRISLDVFNGLLLGITVLVYASMIYTILNKGQPSRFNKFSIVVVAQIVLAVVYGIYILMVFIFTLPPIFWRLLDYSF